jgi:hypothetical protein
VADAHGRSKQRAQELLDMASLTIKRVLALAAPLLGAIALALIPVASQASASACTSTSGSEPEAITGADHVDGTSDELDGTVNSCKAATTYWFRYGPTNSYGQETTHANLPAEPAEPIDISQSATGMQAGWRYVLVAENAKGKVEGKEHTFTVKASKKATKSEIELPQPSEPTPVGGALVLSGTLTGPGNAGREVVLEATPYPYRATFADVGAPTTTNVAGGFSFRVPALSTSTHYRVATVGTPVLISKVVTALAAVHVVLKVRTNSHMRGLVRLYGTVSPAEAGAHVFFQLEKAPKQKLPSGKVEKPRKTEKEETERPPSFSNKFSAIVRRATKSISRFSLVVTIQDAGLYRAFVALPPGPLASGYSQTIALRAAPAKHKRK